MMSDDERPEGRDLGELLGLVVHDLRNPLSTIWANADFLGDVSSEDRDVGEALGDLRMALAEMNRGLEQVAWMAQWLSGDPVLARQDGDLAVSLRNAIAFETELQVEVHVEVGEIFLAKGGQSAERILEILLSGSRTHARAAEARIRRRGEEIWLELLDDGPPLAERFHQEAFAAKGQGQLKGAPDGRYCRFGGLFAARIAAEALGGRLEASQEGDKALFRLVLPAA